MDQRIELYKGLRDEMRTYVERAPGLWLQKFVLLGASIAFLAQFGAELDAAAGGGRALGILALPVIAACIDAKILEYALHARLISSFIIQNFESAEVAVRWERSTWGVDGATRAARLAKYRSLVSILVTVVPTMLLVLLSAKLLATTFPPGPVWVTAAVACALYGFLFWLVWRYVFVSDGSASRGSRVNS